MLETINQHENYRKTRTAHHFMRLILTQNHYIYKCYRE